MSEATHTTNPRAKGEARHCRAGRSAFEFPKFEIPNFEMPKMEVPAAFREFAEKGAIAGEGDLREDEGRRRRGDRCPRGHLRHRHQGRRRLRAQKLIEATRVNTNAAFDFYTELMTVKSYSDVIELSTAHARKQFEAVTAQTKDLAALAQKMATETAEPIKDSVSKVFSKVA